ncbi:hypothetical protein D3C81_2228520 [compost metagenome]
MDGHREHGVVHDFQTVPERELVHRLITLYLELGDVTNDRVVIRGQDGLQVPDNERVVRDFPLVGYQ